MKYSTAIRPWSNRRLEKMGKVDIVIGIATYNNQETIENIIDMVSEGIQKYYRNMKAFIIVADGGSTDDTRDVASTKTVYPFIEKMVTIYRGNPGKSSAYRMIFEMTKFLNARVCVICDPSALNMKPEWIKNLIDPVLIADYGCAIAWNDGRRDSASLSNNLSYSLIRAFFGKQVRQPMGGDYGISGKLASFFIEKEIWEHKSSAQGIDLWITLTAMLEGFKVCQSNIGAKQSDYGSDLVYLEERFIESITSIFEIREYYKSKPKKGAGDPLISSYNDPVKGTAKESTIDSCRCLDAFKDGFRCFSPLWRDFLAKENFEELRELAEASEKNFSFSPRLWARVVCDVSKSYAGWHSSAIKFINCITPLYFGYLAGFLLRTEGADCGDVEGVVVMDAEMFEEEKNSYCLE